MKLYNYYRSSSSYRVRIALNIKQLAYETIPVHLVNHGGEQHHVDYKALNPQALVPTLTDNNHILTQSIAIIEYLEEAYPTPSLLPPDVLARADVRSIALMIACDMHPLNNLRVLNQLKKQFTATEDQIQTWYHQWLKLGFDTIETKLMQLPRQKAICYGDTITIADVCLIPQIYNAKRYHFSIEPYPLINEINNYCLSLTAFASAAP